MPPLSTDLFRVSLEEEEEVVVAGTDAILLTECSGPGAKATIRSIQRADRIAERLVRLEAKTAARDEAQAAKIADLELRREERTQARLERTSNNASAGPRGHIDKARGQGRSQQDCPDGEDTCPKDKGGPSEGKGGGNQGGGNQGGGRKS